MLDCYNLPNMTHIFINAQPTGKYKIAFYSLKKSSVTDPPLFPPSYWPCRHVFSLRI